MRYLVWLLLLANVGVLAWIVGQPAPRAPGSRPAPVPPGSSPLVLLSERTPEAALEPRTGDHSSPVQPPARPGQVAADAQTDSGETPAHVNGEKIAPQPPVTTGDRPEETLVCRTLGPLMTEDDVLAIAASLSDQGYVSHTRTGKVREPSGYWVYLSTPSVRKARQIVAKLDRNGMKDYFIIGKRNTISLGIFSRKDKAQARLEQVQSLGLDASLDQRYRTRKVYWLDIEEQEKPLFVSGLWPGIQASYPDIRAQRVSCD